MLFSFNSTFTMADKDLEYRAVCSKITLQNKKEGFFNQLLENLLVQIDIKDFEDKCHTDLQRVQYCTERLYDKIGAELVFRGKNNEEAIQNRQNGNKAFSNGNYKLALIYYNQAITRSDIGQDLVAAYSNRSALLEKCKEYEAAIVDVELAISYGAADETKHKLYERLTSCYINLKNYAKAKVSLNLARHLAKKHDASNDKFMKKLDKLSSTIESEMKDAKNNTPSPSTTQNENYERNKIYPGASEKFGVSVSPEFGRYAVAQEEITIREEILRTKPYAAVLSFERVGTHCVNCFCRVKYAIPCETCSNVAYCSRDCRKIADSTYHKYECRIYALLIGSGMSPNCFLSLRMITQNSLEELLKIFASLESKPNEIILNAEGKFDANSYENIYNLGALENLRDTKDLINRTIMTVFLLRALRKVEYFDVNLFQNPKPTLQELQIGSLILRNLQISPFNAYEITEFHMDKNLRFRKSTTVSLGLALYPTASFFNHSCNPNVTRYFNGKTMVVESTSTIKKNSPIFDNYGPIFVKFPKVERQRILQGRYWFRCFCDACTEGWQPLAATPSEIEPKSPDESKALKKLQALDDGYFNKAMQAMDVGKTNIASEMLKLYLLEAENIMSTVPKASFKPYNTINAAQEGIRLCTCTKGSVFIPEKVEKDKK